MRNRKETNKLRAGWGAEKQKPTVVAQLRQEDVASTSSFPLNEMESPLRF